MTNRAYKGIDFGPRGNLNRTYNFFCLKNGRILKKPKWNDYPMPQRVINKVNKLEENPKKTEYGVNWEFRNLTEENKIGTPRMTWMA